MSSILGGIFGSDQNEFKAAAPVNTFKADPSQYTSGVNQAQAAALSGTQANTGVQNQQNDLARQLTTQAQGGGPNPALAQLNQTTAQNINNAASQVAGTRGINPALAARMAVDAGAGATQQAAGQAAVMRAQQQIAAQQQLAGVLGQQAGQNIAQQQANTQLLGTTGGLQAGQQQLNQLTGAQNQSADLAAQQINAGVQGQNAQTNAGASGGLLGGLGGIAAALIARGGMVPSAADVAKKTAEKVVKGRGVQKLAEGDEVQGDAISPLHLMLDSYGAPPKPAEPSLGIGKLQGPGREFGSGSDPQASSMQLSSPTLGINSPQSAATQMRTGAAAADAAAATRAKTMGALSAGLGGLGKGFQQGNPMDAYSALSRMHLYGQTMSEGGASGVVPGQPKVDHDTESNDVVPAMLTPGEHVTRLEIAQAPGVREALEKLNNGTPEEASSFAQHLMRRRGSGYDKVVKARRMAEGGETEKPKEAPEGEASSPPEKKVNSLFPAWMAKVRVPATNQNERKMLSQVKGD